MQDSAIISEKMKKDLASAAKVLKNAKDILIVAHIDADGISSAAIASKTCERLGKEFEVHFAKKMDDATIDIINFSKRSAVWIVDLGSGYLSRYDRAGIVVTDHHVPDTNCKKRGQTRLDSFLLENRIEHVNLHVYGMDGSSEGCGATMTYLLSREIDGANRDLAYLSVIGACGDIQEQAGAGLIGLNRIALDDAIEAGDVEEEKDIKLFGRMTRPLVQFLQYGNDPIMEGLSDNNSGCNKLLADLDIPLKEKGRLRVWDDLLDDEKERLCDAILDTVDPNESYRMFGPVYTLVKFGRKGGLRDAKEFATTLNSCGRYDDAPTGIRICFGDESAVADAEDNRAEHRRNISAAIQYVKKNDLIKVRRFIQYFDAGSEIKETVVGIVAGMILNTEGFRRDLPMFAFAVADDGTKVSARADRSLGERGLDLSIVMKTAAEAVGGYGGGHNVAAGATIPEDKKEEFLDIVEDIVASQII